MLVQQNSLSGSNLLLVIALFLTGILSISIQEPSSPPPQPNIPDQFYITFVISGRNDEHQGDFLSRLSNTVHYLGHVSDQIQQPMEVIVVEWNPLPDRPPLATVLENPSKNLFLRIITVPPEIHQKTENFEKIPVQQFIAKNVGIRRARGQFVMATNADIIFGIDFFLLYIKPKKLEEGVFYRADLHMTSDPIPPSTPITSWEPWLREHTHEVRSQILTVPLDSEKKKILYWNDFDIQATKPMSLDRKRITHPLELHLSSPGDFLLMAKSQWVLIKGHPECGLMYGVDSMTQGMCSVLYDQVILPAPVVVYHQWHTMQTTPQGRPKWDANELWLTVTVMLKIKMVAIFNKEDWGLEGVSLEDVYVGKK